MSWYEMAMQDAQEQEASRNKLKVKSSTQGPTKSARIASMSEEAAKVKDLRSKTVLLPSIGSTFLTKREC